METSGQLASGPLAWEQTLTVRGDIHRLEIRPLLGEKSFAPRNTNGSQRGGRPIVQFLPHRIRAESATILEGADLKPLVTHGFLLVPNPGKCDPRQPYLVVFRASRASG